MSMPNSGYWLRIAVAATLTTALATGCYVVPVRSSDGTVRYQHYPLPPPGTVIAPSAPVEPPMATPVTVAARLYPANDLATSTGIVSGAVTNMRTGKGRFVVNYKGEVLNGEATRVANDERRGVASAFGSGGTYMSCEYEMNTPMQGTGNCTFSDGARYQLHIGN